MKRFWDMISSSERGKMEAEKGKIRFAREHMGDDRALRYTEFSFRASEKGQDREQNVNRLLVLLEMVCYI